ncbi:MAG TPA: acetate--CoA ligase family protein [Bryobacteraceae bacterium]
MTSPSVISKLMRPASVAVIGASADAGKTAGRPIAYLQKQGFVGSIHPVNPKADEIAGLKSYPDIASLPQTPDVAIVVLGVERTHLAVRELAARGCPAAIVLGSGYGETGEAGLARQKELMEAAGRMRILGPNTIGVVNLSDGIPLSASGALAMNQFTTGGISLVSQSGGILGSLLSHAAARRIGHSKLVSTGNEVDLDLADFLDWLADDPDTKVIALYVEAIRDAAKFRVAARKAVRAGKPIVAFKVGRSEAGSRAVVSHTGALAGADRSYDALFAQSGVIRATRFADLLDIPAALAAGRRLSGNRIAILTSTGGVAALVSDSLGVAGFDMPTPDAATAAKLRALQTGAHAVLDRNPVDVTLAGLEPKLLSGAIHALLESPSYDAIVVIVGSSSLAMPDLMAGIIRGCLPGSDKPVLAYVSPYTPDIVGLLNSSGVPAFTTPESVSVALAGMLKAAAWREPLPAPAAPANIDIAVFGAGVLDEQRSKQLFAAFGIAVAREIAVTDGARAEQAARELGGKVVLKVLSEKIAHKSEVGGVAVNLTADDIAARLARMRQEVAARTALTPDRFLVQQMVSGGQEMILGLRRESLGVVILLGAGGTAAELMGDTSIRLLTDGAPLASDEAIAMVRELKIWPLLDGYRGRPKADVDALVDAIVAFSAMAARLGNRLVEAEINPLFVLAAGEGVVAADGLAVLH